MFILLLVSAPPELDAPTLVRYATDGLPFLRLSPSSSRRDNFSRYYVVVVPSTEKKMPQDINLEEVEVVILFICTLMDRGVLTHPKWVSQYAKDMYIQFIYNFIHCIVLYLSISIALLTAL